ncbi:MAG: hypothetical protein V3U02_12680, partial [Calditrichia bacterium]
MLKQTKNISERMLVQLNPEKVSNLMFAGCFMTVTKVESWGAQGYIQCPGKSGEPGGQAYYNAKWDEMEFAGCALWIECDENKLKKPFGSKRIELNDNQDNDNQERKPNMLFIVDINTKTVIGTYDIDQRFHCKAQLDRA